MTANIENESVANANPSFIKRINEIENYLKQGDNDLLIRRLLDLCLDSQQQSYLQQAINISTQFNSKKIVDDLLYQNINTLLKQVQIFLPKNVANFSSKNLFTASQIKKQYSKGNFSLHALSTSIKPGEIIGIVGENGNGKTTLLRSLARELSIDDGLLQFNMLNNPDDFTIKHHVAFIPQRIPKWYGLLKDNLHFSASLSGIKGSENDLMVNFMLERLNLTKFANLTWNQISSGYRTRFEIARVLLQKPQLLILDEPLANLDIAAQQTILTDLQFLAKSTYNPMGIVLSSQQLHEVEKVADDILFLKQGKLLYQSKNAESSKEFVIEVETPSPKEKLQQCFTNEEVQIGFNGGFYTLQSTSLSHIQMLELLIQNSIEINYFRNISNSTKRFF